MPNTLAQETSPYLLQHADNPVHWQPWSEAAFKQAAEEDKLVFLSIGYSTCHWCHVMAHESFENMEIAAIMNEHFICVKVDREERPDIDATYMSFIQATTGQGGWPMSVWLTPNGGPVFGGTYFPPDDRHGRPGFPRVCHELGRLWRDDHQQMESRANGVMAHLANQTPTPDSDAALPGDQVFGDFLKHCETIFDPKLGGFGGAPKFPRPVVVRTLMQLSNRFDPTSQESQNAWSMSETTLKAMAAGGMHDHLGGGFHRYSVDRYWHVPHYEKMLYDQAQLAMAYLDAWQISQAAEFKSVADGIFRYLLDTMRDSGGAFHAAEDADSLPDAHAGHTREGAFWTWHADEISALLAPRDAAIFSAAYGVEADGNARPESDPHGELRGQNTLFRAVNDDALAETFDCTTSEVRDALKRSSSTLLAAREKRPKPHRDDKIVSAWNGLAIAALARGGRLFDRSELTQAATEAAAFIRAQLWHDGTLYRSFRGHRGSTPGFPADYACLIHGLIELHASQPDAQHLDWARQLQHKLDSDFWDPTQAGYVMNPTLAGETLMSIRDDYDGAEPSANHVALENLLKLAELLHEPAHADRAVSLLRAGSTMLQQQPFAAPLLLAGFDLHQRGVACVQVPAKLDADLQASLASRYWPRAVFTRGESADIIVCENQVCRPFAPTQNPD